MDTLAPGVCLPAEGFQFCLQISPSDSPTRTTSPLAFLPLPAFSPNSHSLLTTVSSLLPSPSTETPIRQDRRPSDSIFVSPYEALGPNGSIALLWKGILPDGNNAVF